MEFIFAKIFIKLFFFHFGNFEGFFIIFASDHSAIDSKTGSFSELVEEVQDTCRGNLTLLIDRAKGEILRPPIFDMSFVLIKLEEGISGSFSPHSDDSVSPIPLFCSSINISVEGATKENSSEGEVPTSHDHDGDAENQTRKSGELMEVLPCWPPVR